jgi:multiple antibiotic resistance protein
MDESLFQFGLTALVTLAVVVDPLGVAPIFVALTRELDTVERRNTLVRALVNAFGVTVFFLLGGRLMLSYLGVTVHAFAISGGVLLFTAALPMLFGQRPGLQAPERDGTESGGGKHCHLSPGDPTAFGSRYDHDRIAAGKPGRQ